MDSSIINDSLKIFESRIANAKIENAIVITKNGEVYHCTGDLNTIENITSFGEKLNEAQVTHNHPLDSDNEYSFSEDDLYIFNEFKLNLLRGIDERFVYEFNRATRTADNLVSMEDMDFTNYRHSVNIVKAKEMDVGYRRWSR